MTLENLVCSLESAKRLKELGVKQVSLFYRALYNYYSAPIYIDDVILGDDESFESFASAFTVAELGEILISEFAPLPSFNSIKGTWQVKVKGVELDTGCRWEADARAKLLIYLLENKLITL